MANVSSVTPMWGRARWCVSAMSVTTAPIRDAASSVEDPACLMPTTVKSAPSRRKTWVEDTKYKKRLYKELIRPYLWDFYYDSARLEEINSSYNLHCKYKNCLSSLRWKCFLNAHLSPLSVSFAARWLSQDCEFGQLQNRSVLWKEEVWLQEEVKMLRPGPCSSFSAFADFLWNLKKHFFWFVNKALFYISVFISF